LSISGEKDSIYRIRRNNIDISSGILTGVVSYILSDLSGAQTVSVSLTDPAGNESAPSTLSWVVTRYSDPPILSYYQDPSQNTLRIGISGEVGTTYRLMLSGTNVLDSPGQVAAPFTLNLSNLQYGATSVSVSLTNYAGYTTTSPVSTYVIPLVISVSDTTLSWNGPTGPYTVYRLNVDNTSNVVATVSTPSYNASPYSGLTMTFFVVGQGQNSVNTRSLTLPTNTQAIKDISSSEYISAGINSNTPSNILKSVYNSYDSSATLVIVPSGITKLFNVSGLEDVPFAMVLGPSSSLIEINTNVLLNVPILYIAGEPSTSKTLLVDSSYTIIVTFNENSISINNVLYLIDSIVEIGPLVYTVIAFGSVIFKRKYNYVAPIIDISPISREHTSLKAIRSSTAQPDGTSIAESREGREMVRNAIAAGRPQRFPDYSSYLKYIKGLTYVKIQNNIKK
jgi:hypothetical protein